jgi:hypothetical protein
MASPRRPLCVIMGGAKVADKIGVLWAMIDKADIVAVGGRMAFTFLAAQGVCVGETQVGAAGLAAVPVWAGTQPYSMQHAKPVLACCACGYIIAWRIRCPTVQGMYQARAAYKAPCMVRHAYN